MGLFRVYWLTAMSSEITDPKTVRGDRIELPNGKLIRWDNEKQRIDVLSMAPFVGMLFEYFIDGISQGMKKLKSVDVNENGIAYFEMENLPEEVA